MPKRAAIYARASLDVTGEGRSVERQTEECRKLLVSRGIEVVAELQDNSISAYGKKARPGWQKVLRLIEGHEIDYVAAWHLDRMTRSMRDLEDLIQLTESSGVGILTATGDIDLTTDVGRMVARILGAVARAEVERKAARQMLANRQLANTGKPWSGGARPFGYTSNQLAVVPEEADAIRWAAEAVLNGEVSMGEVAREWGRRGLRSSRATSQAWTPRGVKAVLVSPRYVGTRQYRGKSVGPGTWPAILSEETHEALRVLLNSPQRKMGTATGSQIARNLLSQIARCAACDQALRASSMAAGGTRRETYTCPQGHVYPPRTELDHYVSEEMVGLLASDGFLAAVVPLGHEEADKVREELDALRRRSAILAQSFVQGLLDDSTYLGVSKDLSERVQGLSERLSSIAGGSSLAGLSVGTDQVISQWEALPLQRKRAIIGHFLDVVVLPKARRNEPWNPEQHLRVSQRGSGT